MPVIGYPSTISKFRDRTAAMRPIVLRRKTCPLCDKNSTVKQLCQYGACVSCVKARA